MREIAVVKPGPSLELLSFSVVSCGNLLLLNLHYQLCIIVIIIFVDVIVKIVVTSI